MDWQLSLCILVQKYIDDFDATEVDTAVPVYVSIMGLFACLIFFRYFMDHIKGAAKE